MTRESRSRIHYNPQDLQPSPIVLSQLRLGGGTEASKNPSDQREEAGRRGRGAPRGATGGYQGPVSSQCLSWSGASQGSVATPLIRTSL